MTRPLARAPAAAFVAAVVTAMALPAGAAGLYEPHVGGVGVSGPTVGDLTAVYWNPAALALVSGNQFRLSTSFRVDGIGVARAATDPATGGAGTREFPEVNGSGNVQPLSWPPGPGTFLGLGIDVGGRFTLAVAGYTPFFQRVRYQPTAAGELPTRHHAVEVDLRNYALVTALGVRIGRRLSIGIAPGFLFPSGRVSFDQDTALAAGQAGLAGDCGGSPCGVENPLAAARYDLRGSMAPLNGNPAFTLSGGLVYQFQTWAIGASFTSRPLGRRNGGVELALPDSKVTLPATLGGGSLCDGLPGGAACVDAQLGYRLPDMLALGATWYFRPGWALVGSGRYLTFSRHEDLTLRVTGPASSPLGSAPLPSRLVIRRDFRDVLDVRAMVTRTIDALQIAAGLRAATGATGVTQTNPGAVDGFTAEPSLMLTWQRSWLTLSAGYAVAIMAKVSVPFAGSIFAPGAAVACADSGRDLGTAACEQDVAGGGRPSAAGRYTRLTHHFGLGATAQF